MKKSITIKIILTAIILFLTFLLIQSLLTSFYLIPVLTLGLLLSLFLVAFFEKANHIKILKHISHLAIIITATL